MPNKLDISGQRFGRLVAIRQSENKGGFTQWECACDCGNRVVTYTNGLRSGHAKSCGCLKAEKAKQRAIHGHCSGNTTSATYGSWVAMINRCTKPKHVAFKYYGGRGISVCRRWLTFQNFLDDMGPRIDGTTIDRVNNNGNYEPGNCRWATDAEQRANRSSATGKKRPYMYRPVEQLTINGQLIAVHESVVAASLSTSIIPGSISQVCLGKRKTAGGYKWNHITKGQI